MILDSFSQDFPQVSHLEHLQELKQYFLQELSWICYNIIIQDVFDISTRNIL